MLPLHLPLPLHLGLVLSGEELAGLIELQQLADGRATPPELPPSGALHRQVEEACGQRRLLGQLDTQVPCDCLQPLKVQVPERLLGCDIL